MTAQQIVDRIKQQLSTLGIAWRAQTVDAWKAGSPDTEVKAVATTGMATFGALERAAAAGRNFVISHEPTFYNHEDRTASLEGDAVYQAKQRFIKEHDMVVFRFHDHAHALTPDPLVVGSARMLGLTPYAIAAEPRVFAIPETTLRAFAADIAARLNGKAIRVAGDPNMKVRRVALGPGYSVPALGPSVDVSIGGENPESGGNTEYALDAASLGAPKGVILLGHMMSEDWGMLEVANWLKTFLTDVSIEWIPTGEPFSTAGTGTTTRPM
jgi:putative NIF3 family GTP cyclohydrolase 1 type 2